MPITEVPITKSTNVSITYHSNDIEFEIIKNVIRSSDTGDFVNFFTADGSTYSYKKDRIISFIAAKVDNETES